MMRKKALVAITVILLTVLLGFQNSAAQPIPIGDTTQTNPYESNPASSYAYSLFGQIGTPANPRDGDLLTYLGWRIGGSSAPVSYLELSFFENFPPTSFAIGWVDVKVKYSASATRDDKYRITYRVGSSAWQDLQPWISGAGARFDYGGQPDERVWSKAVEPNDGVWDWADIYNIKIRVETARVGGIEDNFANRINVYEVWLSIYEGIYPPPGPGVSIQPSIILGLYSGEFFFVDVFVTDVVNMGGFEFLMTYDTTVLTALEFLTYSPFNNALASIIDDDPWGNGTGYLDVAYTIYPGASTGFTGSEPVLRIYFMVDLEGNSALHLASVGSSSSLVDLFGEKIPVTYWRDGFFSSFGLHDVAITNVSVNATQVMPGEIVEVNVTVTNQGVFSETFTVTAFRNYTAIGSPQEVNLDPGATSNVTFNWDTAGLGVSHYFIQAEATLALDEDPPDNTFLDGTVIVGRHDLTVTNVLRAYPTISDAITPSGILKVERREVVFINVTVQNIGTFTETFAVNASYSGGGIEQPRINGEYVVRTWSGITLDPGASTILTAAWNTSTVMYGGTQNWTLCLMVGRLIEIPYERGVDYDNTLNNFFLDGTVNVTRSAIVRDVAVTSVAASPMKAAPGDIVTIRVSVVNQGDLEEDFTVTAYYDTTSASSQLVTLASQGTTILYFSWNTSGITLGDYTIKADASLVPGEVDISDNTLADGTVTLAYPTLSIELSGAFDFAYRENIRIKVAALVTDTLTLEPVSNVEVSIRVYDDAGALWVSSTMVENPVGSGVYEWRSSGTIYSLGLAKGIYLARVQASYRGGPTTHSILLFHIDPPAEEPNNSLYYVAFTIATLAGVAALALRLRQIFNKRLLRSYSTYSHKP